MGTDGAGRWRSRMLDLDEQIAEAIGEVWKYCQTRFSAGSHEDDITRQLVARLQRRRAGVGNYRVTLQPSEVGIDADGNAVTTGRLDIRVDFDMDYDASLVYECKRLRVVEGNGRRRSLAREYVIDGMMRFIRCQYAERVGQGGMIGYVLDGDLEAASSDVHGAIAAHADVLSLKETLDIPAFGSHRRIRFSSFHDRSRCPSPFLIRHLLMPL